MCATYFHCSAYQLHPNNLGSYSQSLKNFKNGFFRVVVNDTGRSHYYDKNKNLKFLFYWINNLTRYQNWSREDMTDEERRILSFLDEHLCRLLTREIVKMYLSPHP